jgi:hypothetical protein
MNWLRATKIAERAGAYDSSGSGTDGSGDTDVSEKEATDQNLSQEERRKRHQKRVERRAKTSKVMELQYFLELVDQKHRYGSSLRKYHNYWKTQDTNQSFFYWLDEGDGKEVELPECSRERLDREQVRYLSREERLKYLVNIDKDGLLVWAKNGEEVWTKDELYKDSLEGIVPITSSVPAFKYNVPPEGAETGPTSSDSEDESDEDEKESDEGTGYANEDFHRAKGPAKIKYVNSGVIFNHLVRNSMKKGHKWIFVSDAEVSLVAVANVRVLTGSRYAVKPTATPMQLSNRTTSDMSFRLYVGYKQSGAFQHSSFLHGSRITAAGLIKIKHGQLRRLSPLRYCQFHSQSQIFVLFANSGDLVHAAATIALRLSSFVRSYTIFMIKGSTCPAFLSRGVMQCSLGLKATLKQQVRSKVQNEKPNTRRTSCSIQTRSGRRKRQRGTSRKVRRKNAST